MHEGWVKVYQADSRQIAGDCGWGRWTWSLPLPPYWRIKDYRVPGQIGYGQRPACLPPGPLPCVDGMLSGAQTGAAVVRQHRRSICPCLCLWTLQGHPLHAEVIAQCVAG